MSCDMRVMVVFTEPLTKLLTHCGVCMCVCVCVCVCVCILCGGVCVTEWFRWKNTEQQKRGHSFTRGQQRGKGTMCEWLGLVLGWVLGLLGVLGWVLGVC